jgi:hypothetical protein
MPVSFVNLRKFRRKRKEREGKGGKREEKGREKGGKRKERGGVPFPHFPISQDHGGTCLTRRHNIFRFRGIHKTLVGARK